VKATVSSQMVCIGLRKTCFSSRAEMSAGIASSDGYFTKSSYSFLARAGNIVPFLSTCKSTPISNMSAAGAIVTSLYAASDSCLRTMSHEPDCRHIWLIVPVTMKSAPMAYAAAAASGQPMPPPAPTRTRMPVSLAMRSRWARITGSSTGMCRLSVWPPLSHSTATSSHMVTPGASAACSAVTRPFASSFATMSAGGGSIAGDASSVRDTLKMTLLRQTVRPDASRSRPATRYRTIHGVSFMKADASTTRTPRLRKSSTPPDSRPSSAGAWIRLTAYGPLGSAAWILSSPADTMCSGSPPAPNEPSMPFLPAAITRSADAMPLAIAPV